MSSVLLLGKAVLLLQFGFNGVIKNTPAIVLPLLVRMLLLIIRQSYPCALWWVMYKAMQQAPVFLVARVALNLAVVREFKLLKVS
jgi:hypothetical protein